MGRTKKVGAAGKFGVRYGKKIKDRFVDIHKAYKADHICPNCSRPTVKRVVSGIWLCKKCGHKFAGKAYRPS